MRSASELGAFVEIGGPESVDETSLVCRYCRCTPTRPCVLLDDSTPAPYEPRWQEGGGRHAAYPCGWHRIVEIVEPGTGKHLAYFACCTNAECVKAHLADATAP